MAKTDDLEAVIKLAKSAGDVKLVSIEDKELESTPSLAAIPEGVELRDLTKTLKKHRKSPQRAGGNVELDGIQSFVNYVTRYGTANTVIFGDIETKRFEAVINYHQLPKDSYKNILAELEESVVSPDWGDWSASLTLSEDIGWKMINTYIGRDLSLREMRDALIALVPLTVSSARVREMREEYDAEEEDTVPRFVAAELSYGAKCEGRREVVKLLSDTKSSGAKVSTHLFQASLPFFVDGPTSNVFFAITTSGGNTKKYALEMFDEERIKMTAFDNACLRISGLTGLNLFKGKRSSADE